MALHLPSAQSSVSIEYDDFDQTRSHDGYELDDVSKQPATTPPSHQDQADTEQQHLVQNPGHRSKSHKYTKTQDRNAWAKIVGYFQYRSPFNENGRRQIKKDILSSGPVTRVSTDPLYSPFPSFRKRWRLYGWRFGVFVSVIAVSVCLLVEIVMLICAVSLNKPQGNKNGIGILYEGSCAKVERLTNILAVPLNIIATVLVATSNYVMQCLCAPTRKDIDEAHSSGKYLDIGIPSIHNLTSRFSWKSVLWLLLVLSTIPIHLLLNSAFFGALQANNYGVLVATTDWKDTQPPNDALAVDFTSFNTSSGLPLVSFFISQFVGNFTNPTDPDEFQSLNKEDCFERYSAQLQTTASNVLVVTTQDTSVYSTLPRFNPDIENLESPYYGPLDPMHSFQMQDGVGLYYSPFTGNAVPVLDPSYHWIHEVIPQNTSGGLYLRPNPGSFPAVEIQSVFSAFDYHYWMTIQQLEYDFNNSDILRAARFRPSSWLCNTDEVIGGQSCTSGKHPAVPGVWQITPEKFPVERCISQTTAERCSLQYSFIILVVVIVCDIVKIVAMSATLMLTAEDPLATTGDAIASFLQQPDPTTRGCCLVDRKLARQICQQTSRSWRFWSRSGTSTYLHANKSLAERLGNSAMTHKRKVVRWLYVPTKTYWLYFVFLYAALLGTSTALLALGIQDLQQMGIDDPFNQGFGSINPDAVFAYRGVFNILAGTNSTFSATNIQQTNKEQSLFAVVVTVNAPQLLFSMLYFMYNAIFTTMVASSEWSSFATIRKALRVSQPRVGQRSSYWLQLPWKYSLPLLSMSILLHWLVSRSFFVVRIRVFGWDGLELPDRDITACGYSPLAVLMVMLIVGLSLAVILGVGFQTLNPDMPVCGTNSIAISAACHIDDDGNDIITTKPLRWGVTRAANEGSPGHCSMSDNVIGLPVEGMNYR